MRRVEQSLQRTSLTFTARTVFQQLQQPLQHLPLAVLILLQELKLILALVPLQVHNIPYRALYQYQYLNREYYLVGDDPIPRAIDLLYRDVTLRY